MNYKPLFYLGLLLLFLYQPTAQAQNNRQNLIRKNLTIIYMPDPNDDESAYYIAAEDIFSEEATADLWSNSALKPAQDLLTGLFSDRDQGGDARLQRVTYRILQMGVAEDMHTNIIIVDDSQGPVAQEISDVYGDWLDAENQIISGSFEEWEDGVTEYNILLGAHEMSNMGSKWVKGQFAHGLMHSRNHPGMAAHQFYPLNEGSNSVIMTVPNIEKTYWESIANMASYLTEADLLVETFDWFSVNGIVRVKAERGPEDQQVKGSPWLFDRLKVDSEGEDVEGMPGYRQYRLFDLHPQAIINNEAVMGMLLSRYAKYVGYSNTFRTIHQETPNALRANGNYMGSLLDKLCQQAYEQRKEENGQVYLLPVALADYFIDYNASTVEDFSALFDDQLPRHWIETYFQQARKPIFKRFGEDVRFAELKEIDFIVNTLKSQPSGALASSKYLESEESEEPVEASNYTEEEEDYPAESDEYEFDGYEDEEYDGDDEEYYEDENYYEEEYEGEEEYYYDEDTEDEFSEEEDEYLEEEFEGEKIEEEGEYEEYFEEEEVEEP